jgi:hypothetical protein
VYAFTCAVESVQLWFCYSVLPGAFIFLPSGFSLPFKTANGPPSLRCGTSLIRQPSSAAARFIILFGIIHRAANTPALASWPSSTPSGSLETCLTYPPKSSCYGPYTGTGAPRFVATCHSSSCNADQTSQGVSLITQALYALVFLTRYLDLFDMGIFDTWGIFWNFCFKVFYIASSLYIIFLMTFVYARTREREKAWKFGMYCLGAAVVLAWPTQQIFKKGPEIKTGDGNKHYLYIHDSTFKEVGPQHSCTLTQRLI